MSHAFDLDSNEGGSRLDFSPNGRWVALTAPYSGSSSTEVRALETASRASLPGSFAAVFSPDSTVLAIGGIEPEGQLAPLGADRTVRFWCSN